MAGPSIHVGRNSHTTPSAGNHSFTQRDGVVTHLWIDDVGCLRVHTAAPADAATDTAGTSLGCVPSARQYKNVLGPYTDHAAALASILATPLFRWTYKDSRFDKQEFTGIVTDDAPQYGLDRGGYVVDPQTGEKLATTDPRAGGRPVEYSDPAGRALNMPTLVGHLIASIKELERRIKVLEGR